jgi:hypothetical protein
MKFIADVAGRRTTAHWILVACGQTLALLMQVVIAGAQTSDMNSANAKPDAELNETIHLNNIMQKNALDEMENCLRTILPKMTIDSLPSQQTLSVRGSVEDIEMAKKIIGEFDRPRAAYRLTFTMSGADGGKSAEAQTFSLVADPGEKTEFKQERQEPIVGGRYDTSPSTRNNQVQDHDVRLSVEVTVDGFDDRLRLRTKLERSTTSEEKPDVRTEEPIVKLAVLERATTLALGKEQMLGSIDMLGNGDKLLVSVVAERVE